MSAETLLTPSTYQLLQRIPSTWWNEDEAIRELSIATASTLQQVRGRLVFLISERLVERRKSPGIVPATEIRKVGR